MKETIIEKEIVEYIKGQGGWVQRLHSGKVIIKKGPATYAMHLAEKGSPDLIGVLYGQFLGIEVKSDEEKKEKWLKLQKRYKTEKLPPSYHREEAQIEQSKKIEEAGGMFIIACSVDDVKKVIY